MKSFVQSFDFLCLQRDSRAPPSQRLYRDDSVRIPLDFSHEGQRLTKIRETVHTRTTAKQLSTVDAAPDPAG
jgi:hypothetical protein